MKKKIIQLLKEYKNNNTIIKILALTLTLLFWASAYSFFKR